MRATADLRKQLRDAGFNVDPLGGDFVLVSGPPAWVGVLDMFHPYADLTVTEILEGVLGDDYRAKAAELMLIRAG